MDKVGGAEIEIVIEIYPMLLRHKMKAEQVKRKTR